MPGPPLIDDGDDPLSDVGGVLVVPEAEHDPATLGEDAVGVLIPLAAAGHLVGPERPVQLRGPVMGRTPLPVASVDEHGDAQAATGCRQCV